jgi:hypothetical protein
VLGIRDSLKRMSGRLEFYWCETRRGEEAGAAWGQLAGAAHRLRFVCDEMETCTRTRNVEQAVKRLEYHMENYLVRIYELRERAVSLVATMEGHTEIAGLLKSTRRRAGTLQNLRCSCGSVVEAIETLLVTIGADVALRNQHTHDKFLSVGILTENDIYHPADALLDTSEHPEARRKLSAFLRKEIKRLVDEYVAKGDAVTDATWVLLQAARQEPAH